MTARPGGAPPEIGPFAIERRLAHQPGVTSLYAAHGRREAEPVALRVLAFASGTAAWRAHERAATQWRRLAHAGLVPLVDTGRGRHGVWVATRRPSGSTLAEHLRGGPLEPERAIAVLAPVADALDLVHARELVCDALTADAVLVSGPPGAEHGVLADVGPAWPPQWRPGRLLGDADGLAPEEIRGRAPSRASNVYALSALLFRCLTGAPPFPARARAAALAAHLHDPVPRASERRPGLPAALDDVLAAGLAKDPAERPASAGELLRRTALAVAGGVEAPPPAASAPAAAAGSRPGPPDLLPPDPPAPIAAPEPAAKTGRRRATARLILLAPAVVLLALAAYLATRPPAGPSHAPAPASGLPDAPPGAGRTVASATLRPPGAGSATGAVRVDERGNRLVITIGGARLPPEGRDPVQAYTVWLINSRADALRLGAITPPVGMRGRFLSHGTLPRASSRYRRIVVTLETELSALPRGPIVLAARLRIPRR
jgi:hypothetical protein